MTARQLKGQPQSFQHVLGDATGAVGAEILRPIVGKLADHRYFRVHRTHVQPQIRIALVVLEKDVVLGHIPLDQGAFQHQSLKFRGGYDHIKVVDFAHHHSGLWGVGGGVLKILAHPVFQLLGLADINNLVGLIAHDIDPRRIGQGQSLFLEFVKCREKSSPLTMLFQNPLSNVKMPPQCVNGHRGGKNRAN